MTNVESVFVEGGCVSVSSDLWCAFIREGLTFLVDVVNVVDNWLDKVEEEVEEVYDEKRSDGRDYSRLG